MIKGLTRAGIGDVGSIENFVKLASQYGFGAIDTHGTEVEQWVDKDGLENVREQLLKHEVTFGAFLLPVEWRYTEAQFQSGLVRLVKDAELSVALGCTNWWTYVLPATDYDTARFTAVSTKRLRICAQILGAYGIRLGLEFIGPHHMRSMYKNPFLWNIPGILEWIDAINEKNVGLLLDCFHWYTSEGTLEDLYQLNVDQVVHVHINDARHVPVKEVLDNDRLFAGEGVIPVIDFLQALKRIGYNGVIAQEILTPNPVATSPENLLSKSAMVFKNLFAAAGLE